MQVAVTWWHRGDTQSITKRDCWQKGGPESREERLRGSSLQTFGVHLKEWSTAIILFIILAENCE